jgi:hypothetical protein
MTNSRKGGTAWLERAATKQSVKGRKTSVRNIGSSLRILNKLDATATLELREWGVGLVARSGRLWPTRTSLL